MKIRKTILIYIFPAVIGFLTFLLASCSKKNQNDVIIFSGVSSDIPARNFISGKFWRYLPDSRIYKYNPHKPSKPPEVITKDFFSARAPQISYDGRSMIFAGQLKENEPWHIWEMNLKSLDFKKVTTTEDNCTDPAYLPDGRILFSMHASDDTLKAGHSLYICNPDGSGLTRITFNPHTYFASDIMMDGRILTISRQVFPDARSPMIIVMRPDGTKADLFYGMGGTEVFLSRPMETEDGRIVFVEAPNDNPDKGMLASITYNRPLASKSYLSEGISGEFYSVFPKISGKLFVTYRKSPSDHYGLYEFDPDKKSLGNPLLSTKDYNILEAVVVQTHKRPRKLPSEVDPHVKTGLLLCQDINILDPALRKENKMVNKVCKIEVLGINSSLGTVDVESDGSFYLKPIADMPIRIRALDENDNVIYGPCNWIYLRPNERRGCIGCHEDYNLVPDNRIPFSVKKSPVIIPIHIKKIKEKTVELE